MAQNIHLKSKRILPNFLCNLLTTSNTMPAERTPRGIAANVFLKLSQVNVHTVNSAVRFLSLLSDVL